jgi:hypothetical protein
MYDLGLESFACTGDSSRPQIFGYLGLATALILSLHLTSLYNCLLLRCLAVTFSILVAFMICLIAWNSRRFLDNNYLLFLGISHIFAGLAYLIHALAHKVKGFFQWRKSNLASQLWITARYFQSGSLLMAPFFVGRTLRPYGVLATYSLLSVALFGTIFYWKIFPDCFSDGTGLMEFKIISRVRRCLRY